MPKNARKRLLVFNCHEAWAYQLTALPFDLDIVVGLSGLHTQTWDQQIRPIPNNGRLIDLEQAKQSPCAYDCIIANNITDLLDVKHRHEPKILVLHLPIEARQVVERAQTSREQMMQSLHQYIKMIGAHVVAVTRSKGQSWGFTDDVVPCGIDAKGYFPHEGNRAEGLRICNFALQRQAFLHWDLHKKAFGGLPIQIVGHNPGMGRVSASRSWGHLKHLLQIHRFYVHTADPLLEDGFNMATIEAMAAGLPVLGNSHPSSPVKHGVSGFLSDDPKELRHYAELLLANQDLARDMGQEARKTAMEDFSLEAFVRRFSRSIETARTKHHSIQRPTVTPLGGSTPSAKPGIIALGAQSRRRSVRKRKVMPQ